MEDSDLHIPLDVLEEATSDIPLRVPGGAAEGSINEPVVFMGSTVNRGGKIPEGRIVVEVNFKVADHGSTGDWGNRGKTFRHSFWLSAAALKDRMLMANDRGTKAAVARLKELASTLGVDLSDGNWLSKYASVAPEMLSGKPVAARFRVAKGKDGKTYFNINGFGPEK